MPEFVFHLFVDFGAFIYFFNTFSYVVSYLVNQLEFDISAGLFHFLTCTI